MDAVGSIMSLMRVSCTGVSSDCSPLETRRETDTSERKRNPWSHQLPYADVLGHLVTWLKLRKRQICVSTFFGTLCDLIPYYRVSTVRILTSPGNVVLLPHLKEIAESRCCGYGRTNKHTREQDFLPDGNLHVFTFTDVLL